MKHTQKILFILGLVVLLIAAIFLRYRIEPGNFPISSPMESPVFGVNEETVYKDLSFGGEFAPPDNGAGSMVIATYRIEAETKNFQKDVDALRESVNIAEGYISAHNIGTHSSNGRVYKVGDITLRVPKDKISDVVKTLRDRAYILVESSNSNDVTKQYRDLEASIKSLEEQELKLNELFTQAKTIDEIIKLDEKVRTIIREKEQLQRSFLSMKDEVSYSRVDIRIKEVSEYTMMETVQDGSMSRIKNAFIYSFKNIEQSVTAILVFVASLSPFLILISFGGLIYVRIKKKKSDKNE